LLSRREFIGAGVTGVLGSVVAGCRHGDVPFEGLPDLVILVADSLRASSLPVYGYPRPTAPFLTGLARRSTLFEHCYSSATWTRPAVTGILSGLTVLEHQQWRFEKAYPSSVPCFASSLRQLGYATGFLTANHAVGAGYGAEALFDHVDHGAADVSDFGPRLATDCLRWVAGLDANQPVFAYVHYFPPHGPYDPPDEYLREIAELPLPPASLHGRGSVELSLGNSSLGRIPWYQVVVDFSRNPRSYLDRYDANVRYADNLLEDFFVRWRQQRPHRRTVFLLTADHGESLGEHGQWFDHARLLSNQNLHIPLLVHDTGRPKMERVGAPVSNIELGAALVELARAASGKIGSPSAGLLSRARRSAPEQLLVSQVAIDRGESGWALTRGRWRLVYNDAPRDGTSWLMWVSGDREGASGRYAAAVPTLAMIAAHELAPGIAIESLVADAEYLVAGKPVRFTVVATGEGHGVLELRFRDWSGRLLPIGSATLEAGRQQLDFEATIPEEKLGPRSVLEASWRGAGTGGTGSDDWVPLLDATILRPAALDGKLEFLGVQVEPGVAWPGSALRLRFVWNARQLLSKRLAVETAIVDDAGRRHLQTDRLLLRRLPADAGSLVPLIENWRLRSYPFVNRQLRFDEVYWESLPAAGMVPGAYSISVRLFEYESERSPADRRYTSDELQVGPLLLVEADREQAERRIAEDGLGVDHLRTVASKPAGTNATDGALDRVGWAAAPVADRCLASRAEARYREAERLGASSRRAESLYQGALALSTAHLGGLRALGHRAPTSEVSARLVELDVTYPLDIGFGEVIGLRGFGLERSPRDASCLSLSLVFETLALFRQPLAATAWLRAFEAAGAERGRSSAWWFLGGAARPTCRRHLGEGVRETVRFGVMSLPEGGEVEVRLRIGEQWPLVYADNRLRPELPSGGLVEDVILPRVAVDEIPTGAVDDLERRRASRDGYWLYDLWNDPTETTNLATREPVVLAEMKGMLRRLLAEQDVREAAPEDDDRPLTPEQIRQLKTLGYIV
jgi:arylsulfatase A-like enzyme